MPDAQLSDMKATYTPPKTQPQFMGSHTPVKNGQGSLYDSGNINYFQSYRNENMFKFQMPPYEWGLMSTPYSPRADLVAMAKKTNWAKMLQMPRQQGNVDYVRMEEVDNFYKAAQMHREQYKDHSGRIHPLDYFKRADYVWQCPPDPTRTYMKFPQYYTKYKSPPVLPLTLERSNRCPPLPERILAGRYNHSNDISYKR